MCTLCCQCVDVHKGGGGGNLMWMLVDMGYKDASL